MKRSARSYCAVAVATLLTIIVSIWVSQIVSAEFFSAETRRAMVTRTWDGGGATNNWSEDANWTGDAVPGSDDAVVFDGTSTKDATLDIDVAIPSLQIVAGYSGTITQGSSSLTLGNIYEQLNGTFIGGSGGMSVSSTFTLNGGSFTAPTGTLTLSNDLTVASGATFNANNGTVSFVGAVTQQDLFLPPSLIVNNVVVNKLDTAAIFLNTPSTLITTGTLSLINGRADRNSTGTLEARGDVSIAQTFDGETPGQPARLVISGTGTRTVTVPAGGARMLPLTVNAPNVTLNTSGPGAYAFNTLDLQSCAGFTNGSTSFLFDGNVTSGSGCGFTQGPGDVSFTGSYTQNGGTFTSGTGALEFRSSFDLNGGTFVAPAGSMSFFQHVLVAPGTTFNPNGGTVVFTGNSAQQFLRIPTTFTLNNVMVDRADNTELFWFNSPTTLVVAGTLALTNGRLERNSTGTIDARGDIIVASTFDGGVGPAFNPAFFLISGGANQTYTNSGGVNPGATWTINKSTGTLTAASSLILQTGQTLNLTSGTLYLNENSYLTAGAINIGSGGRLVNESSTTITLGGNLSNSGTIHLNGGGAGCPATDSILIRSSSAAQRAWSGGSNRLIDVDIQNMGGTGTKTVYSGTDSGGNNATWVFDNACPPELAITPSVAGVPAGEQQIFTAAGGFPPYTFSLPVNNSGASINSVTGRYTAGTVMGASDIVRVTDGSGATAEATVSVVGAPVKLGFIVQPSNTAPGQTITPPVKVAAQDANGNTVTTINPTITLSIATNPSGGILSGTLTRAAIFGVATFDDLSINSNGNGYTLGATNVGLTTATSNGFNISPVLGPPVKLGFVVQPSNAIQGSGSPMTPPVQVAIQDANGNTIPSASASVSINPPAGNPTGLTLSGTIGVQTVNGVATFDQLFVGGVGEGHTLVASADSLTSATSASFEVFSPYAILNTNDSGPGSLRQAIINANNRNGTDDITFDIPGSGPHTILLQTPLPAILQTAIIDGRSQPGFAGAPIVELRPVPGALPMNGLLVFNGETSIQGLVLNGFNDAIILHNAGYNLIRGNYIGTNVAGSSASPNVTGIRVRDASSNNLIGGPLPADRNIISGNTFVGVLLDGTNNTLRGNYIGTSAAGNAAIPNSVNGILIFGNNNIVRNNVVSGNTFAGISISTFSDGVDNLIQDNIVGMTADATGSLGNGSSGILIRGDGPQRNKLTGNRVYGNTGAGIKLTRWDDTTTNTPVLNDPLDVDTGPNGLQNYPKLFIASNFNGVTRVAGRLKSAPSTTYRLEFFSSPTCDRTDPSLGGGEGEGETFVGQADLMTDAGGIGYVDPAVLPVMVPEGRYITATATDPLGNTSEFSICQGVINFFEVSGYVLNNGQPVVNAPVELSDPQYLYPYTILTNSAGFYSFTYLSSFYNYSVAVKDPNLTFTPSSRLYPNLSMNHTNQNFTQVSRNSSLRGSARTDSAGANISAGKGETRVMPPVPAGGFPLLGVTFNVTGPGVNRNVTNDRFGNFRLDALPSGTYVVTPSKPNYVFSPPAASVTIGGIDQSVDFDGESLGLSQLAGRIVYDSRDGVNAMNADGSGVVVLSANLRTAADISPRLSENGRRLAFVRRSTTGSQNRIIAVDSDGTGSESLASESSILSSPVFSPDGTRVAFSNAANILHVMNSDGSNVQSVVSNCSEPDWSPDSTRIVCLEDNGGTTRVKTVNLNMATQATVDNTSGRKFSPRWSPDGTKIAFIRRQSGAPSTHSVVVRNLFGGTDTLMSGTNDLFQSLSWSPDGARLLFVRDSIAGINSTRPPGNTNKQLVTIQSSDGQNMLVIVDGFQGTRVDWGSSNSFATPSSPTPTTINAGAVSISFPSTSGMNGFTTITPIEPNSAGTAPNGFAIGNFAFEINTTAGYTPPVTICIDLDTPGVQSRQMPPGGPALMHNENGVLVNITTSYDETTRILCGQANSFSPFVVAEQINTSLSSITGLVIDSNGARMSGVTLDLTGAETGQIDTDSNGMFRFVNLANGGNYSVQPRSVGYLFSEYGTDFLAVTGEATVVFRGTETDYQIGGRVVDFAGGGVAGVRVTLEGSVSEEAITDATGYYLFSALLADGIYFISVSGPGLSFAPGQHSVSPLTSDVSGVNFTAFAPTAASVSISGRVYVADGKGINKAKVYIADDGGNVRHVLTNGFGYYRFDGVEVGGVYTLSVEAKRHQFENPVRTISVVDELTDMDFISVPIVPE